MLLESLDKPNLEIEAAWASECERRDAAFKWNYNFFIEGM